LSSSSPVETCRVRDKIHLGVVKDIGKSGDETTTRILAFLKRLKIPSEGIGG
jgi:hypothetical protein